MTMADVFMVTLILLGLVIVMPATWLLFGALWPSAVDRARARIPMMPVRTFLAGVGTSAVFSLGVGGLGAANLPPLALFLAAVGLGWAFLGLSGLARHVGYRLTSSAEPPWRAHVRGSVVLALAFLVPVLGWLLIFPVSLILGTGAATLSIFNRPSKAPAPAPESKVEEKVEVPA